MDRSLIVQEAAVTGLTVSDDIVVYTLKGLPTDGDRIAELFELLSDCLLYTSSWHGAPSC